jgi:DNA-binding NtrC family response regulator
LLNVDRESCIGRTWREAFDIFDSSSLGQKISDALDSSEVIKLAPYILGRGDDRSMLVDGIIGPMDPGAVLIIRSLSEIDDPLEAPPSPEEALAHVEHDRLAHAESSMCQLLIEVESKSGLVPGDLERLTSHLNQMLRATDLVSRYGDNQLSVSMPYTSVSDGRQIAASILESLGTLDLSAKGTAISIGLASTLPGDQQPLELFRRASWALNIARESGGNRVILWNENAERPSKPADGQRHREYQNLVLLWNIMNVVVKAQDMAGLAEKLCWHLCNSFSFNCVAVLEQQGDAISAFSGVVSEKRTFDGVSDLSLSQEDFERMRALVARGKAHGSYGTRHIFAIDNEYILFIEANEALTPGDIDFLQTLVSYFGAGFSRYTVAERSESESISEGLLYSSPRMESIVDSVKLVAPTDATVLIVGESGTGKGELAAMIHRESPRRDKAFITVDCGAVATSLIESELFGHVRGAFTGADRNFSGRLKEAEGGTVFLDEIGELPLDVQVKLLRFVQDHEVAAVGSARYERVDTRVIAATNRDLTALVEAGEFREDLFYRLNVFTIETPPLRDREDDIQLLARHFLAEYATQYDKKIDGFTPEAERALLQQQWAGNVRELMNVINRAVILCRDSRVSNIHLGFFANTDDVGLPAVRERPRSLEAWLGQLVDDALASGELVPLGQWLEEDLIETTLRLNGEVMAQTATTLGIPESTLRRKVSRYREETVSRPRYLDELERMVSDLARRAEVVAGGMLGTLSMALLKEVEARRLNRKDAAAIMGVSLPTYRKMVSGHS